LRAGILPLGRRCGVGGIPARRYRKRSVSRLGSCAAAPAVRPPGAIRINSALRSSQCAAHKRSKMVSAQSLGYSTCEANRAAQAVARKLAVILHLIWIDGTDFKWSSKETAEHKTIKFPSATGRNQRPCRDPWRWCDRPWQWRFTHQSTSVILRHHAEGMQACPTAERTLNPAGTLLESLDRRPGSKSDLLRV